MPAAANQYASQAHGMSGMHAIGFHVKGWSSLEAGMYIDGCS